MSKAKTEVAEAEKPPVTTPEGQDTVTATDQAPEGQDTVAATDQAPEGQDTVAATDQAPEGQDSVAATDQAPEGQDVAGADAQPLERISEEEKQRLAEEAEAEAAAAAEAERLAQEAAAAAEAERLAQEAAAAAEAERLAQEAAEVGPVLNLQALTHLTRSIDMFNTTGHRLGLVDELKQLYGAQIEDADGNRVTVEMEGIRTEPADSVETALANWANAARRAMNEVAA